MPRSAQSGPRKASVTIVGAGRLGAALAVALERAGHTIDALVATTRAHARRSARLLRAAPLALAADELDQLPDSGIVIISTPDDRVAETAARLADSLRRRANDEAANVVGRPIRDERASRNERARGSERAGRGGRARVALHASGALSSRELAPLEGVGFAVGSLHPLVSVSDPDLNSKDFAGAYFCVEGDRRAARAARALVRALGGRPFAVAARDKSLYHASAVFAAGHLVALFDLATELLARCGLSRAEARRVLLPLARGTVSNLSRTRSNAEAMTGPFARADISTISLHLGALATLNEAHGDPGDAHDAYALLGLRSLRLAETRGVDRLRLAEIADTLTSFINRGS